LFHSSRLPFADYDQQTALVRIHLHFSAVFICPFDSMPFLFIKVNKKLSFVLIQWNTVYSLTPQSNCNIVFLVENILQRLPYVHTGMYAVHCQWKQMEIHIAGRYICKQEEMYLW